MAAILKNAVLAFIGFGSGIVISGAVFALITVLGVVPRLAQKTKTESYIKLYEESILLGGVTASLLGFFNPYLPVGRPTIMLLSLCIGIFYGCLAVALAEVLNVLPLVARRTRLQRGMVWLVLAFSFGKMFGSILYFLIPGYYHF